MAQSKPPITGTAHTLPFDKLSPRDFERLCFWLVQREGFERAEHLGAAGSEQGRDIVAWREGDLWAFQCKRVEEFRPRDAEAEVDKVLGLPEDLRPVALVFLVACDVSDETRRRARAQCGEEMGCEFWGLTELDERVKDHPEIVEEFFEAGGDGGGEPSWWRRFRRRPAVFYPTLGFGIVAAIVGLVAGLVGIGADLGGARGQLQEWGLVRAFPREGRDETLIVIASFYHSENVPDTEAHWEICRAIREAKADLGYSDLRVEVEPTRLRAGDRDGAEKLGRHYNASMIIWGADTVFRVTVNYLNLKHPEFAAAEVEISDTEATYEDNPRAYKEFVTRDLSGQLMFLSLFAIGHSYYTEGAYAESLEAIERAIDSLPSETETPEGLASAYFRLGWLHQVPMDDDEQAIACYERAIELNPEYATAFNNRGNAYCHLGDYERAIVDLDRAIELNPRYAPTFNDRGLAYSNLGEYARAIADFDRAIDIDLEFKEAYVNRGAACGAKGDYDAAIADYNKAIDIDPDLKEAYVKRGAAYWGKGDYDAAIADYNKAIDIDPDLKEAYVKRGAAYWGKGDYDTAIADYNKAIDIDLEFKEAYVHRGLAYRAKGDYDAAIADYTQAVDIDPQYTDAYLNRGAAYGAKGDYDATIADYNKAIDIDPEFKEAYVKRGAAYWGKGDYDTAIADYNKAIDIDLEFKEAYVHRGLAYRAKGDYDAAIADYDKAIDVDPQFKKAYLNRGVAYRHKGDFDAAIADYTQAIDIDPQFEDSYFDRGLAYRHKGEYEAALGDFRRYLELRPDAEDRETVEGWIAELEAGVSEP